MNKPSVRHQFTSKPSSTRLRKDLDAGNQLDRAESTFQAPVASKADLLARREAANRARTKNFWIKTTALGAIALFGIFGAPEVAKKIAPTATGQTYTKGELAGMPQRNVTVAPNEGVDAAILQVKANESADLFSDGADLAAVREYVEGQHPGPLQPGEHVDVPLLPPNGN